MKKVLIHARPRIIVQWVITPVWTMCAGWSTFCGCGQCKIPLSLRIYNRWFRSYR